MLLHQGFDGAAPALCAVSDDHLISPGLRRFFDGEQAAAEKHVAEGFGVTGVDHHADRAAQAAGQAARQGIGMIIQLPHGRKDPFLGIGRDGGLSVDHPGNGG